VSKQKTIAQTIIDALVARGYTVVAERSRTSKYTVLHKEGSSACWVWVGAAGAARFSGVKRFDSSIPFGDRTRAALLAGRADNLNATAI
jgi:hypothetical protein